MHALRIQRFAGDAIKPYITDLAALRIKVFHDYPYLYAGNLAYEETYLKTYTDCAASVLIAVFADNKMVGASTAIPMQHEMNAIKAPFISADYDLNKIFYLGESVLLPEYRGQKVYPQFFTEREAAAREQGFPVTAFCAVEREPQHPSRPAQYRPLDEIWKKAGYTKHPELTAYFSWPEIGATEETTKPLTFWLKTL